ncbi:SGNH/GDSL hydrolase family protein [Azospirillum rugosum]|uniref:SGNH hydrolase-type esterase domain-containing protein n=1 Tax=Azospirillum rugosum TaxID=416170 RepID=A0ABS4SPZ1_9PROT|nr:hypothetical protein [Azospirillum rugosum]MBP2294304.1 hypothetical protein [Azospirillum rugosum]MDQ0527639.1 hypothetical protein [Azospirillum rugosum]
MTFDWDPTSTTLLGLILLAFVLACEAAVRLACGVPLGLLRNFIRDHRTLMESSTLLRYDPLLGWSLAEPTAAERATMPNLIGAHGIRASSPDRLGVVEGGILAVGDSFTFGSDVLDHESWPAQLEQALGEPVINAACGGWAADQAVLRAEALVPVFKPKTVIVSCSVESVRDTGAATYAGVPKPYFLVEEGRLVHHNNPVPPTSAEAGELGALRAVLGHSYLVVRLMQRLGVAGWSGPAKETRRTDSDPVEVTRLLLRRLRRLGERHGFRTVFVMQYGAFHIVGRHEKPYSWVTRFLDALRADGIEFVDTWPLVHGTYKQGMVPFIKLFQFHDGEFGHMSIEGNRVVADMIADHLRRQDAAPARAMGSDASPIPA